LGRRNEALLRMIPAHERLDADDSARPKIHFRLIMHDKFLPL